MRPSCYLPRPVTEVAAKRIENDIVLQFTVPTVNTDGSGPADLRKIEVYAHTGPLPAPTDFLKYGTLVASVDIKQPPEPEEEQKAESKEQGPVSQVPDAEAAANAEKATELAAAKQKAEAAAKADADRQVGMIEQGCEDQRAGDADGEAQGNRPDAAGARRRRRLPGRAGRRREESKRRAR